MTTRRAFLGAAAAGVVAAAQQLSAAYRLNTGIGTYSYHNLAMDTMIAQLNALLIKEIE